LAISKIIKPANNPTKIAVTEESAFIIEDDTRPITRLPVPNVFLPNENNLLLRFKFMRHPVFLIPPYKVQVPGR